MTIARHRFVPQLLRLLPTRLLAVLDGWSYQLARRRAEQRRKRTR